MATRSGKKTPFSVQGTVTVDGSAYQGAIVWLKDYGTGGDGPQPVDGVGFCISDSGGKYNIGLTGVQSNYADQDLIRVSCMTQHGRIKTTEFAVDMVTGKKTVNFTFTTNSGLVDGAKGSPLTNRSGALDKNQLETGCNDGIQ
jgi:hypothetical protein